MKLQRADCLVTLQAARPFHAEPPPRPDAHAWTGQNSAVGALLYLLTQLTSSPVGPLVTKAISAGSNVLPSRLVECLPTALQNAWPTTKVASLFVPQDQEDDASTPSSTTCSPDDIASSSHELFVKPGPPQSSQSHRNDVGPSPTAALPEEFATNALGLVFHEDTPVDKQERPSLGARSRRPANLSLRDWNQPAYDWTSEDKRRDSHPFDPKFSPPFHSPTFAESPSYASLQQLPPTPPSPAFPRAEVRTRNPEARSEEDTHEDSDWSSHDSDDEDEYFQTPPTFVSGPGSPAWTSPVIPLAPPPTLKLRHRLLTPPIRPRPSLPVRARTMPLVVDDDRGRSPKSNACARRRQGSKRSPPRRHTTTSRAVEPVEDERVGVSDESTGEITGDVTVETDERFVDLGAIRRSRRSHAQIGSEATIRSTTPGSASPSPPPSQSLALVSSVPDWTAATVHRKRSKSLFFSEQWRLYALGKENERRVGEGYWLMSNWVDLD